MTSFYPLYPEVISFPYPRAISLSISRCGDDEAPFSFSFKFRNIFLGFSITLRNVKRKKLLKQTHWQAKKNCSVRSPSFSKSSKLTSTLACLMQWTINLARLLLSYAAANQSEFRREIYHCRTSFSFSELLSLIRNSTPRSDGGRDARGCRQYTFSLQWRWRQREEAKN